MAGNSGSAAGLNAAMETLQLRIEEYQNAPPDLASEPPIENQPPEDAIDCQRLSAIINMLQDLHIRHCPGV